jgi:hypothetical protein
LSKIGEARLDDTLMYEGDFPLVEMLFRDQLNREYPRDVTVLLVEREAGDSQLQLTLGAVIFPEGTRGWYKSGDVDKSYKKLYQYLNITKLESDKVHPCRYFVEATTVNITDVNRQVVYFGTDQMVATLAFERELTRFNQDTKIVTMQYAGPIDNEQPVELVRAAVIYTPSFSTAYKYQRKNLELPLWETYQELLGIVETHKSFNEQE